MIRLEIGIEIRHRGVMSLCSTEDKTAVVVVASYRSVARNPVRFRALVSSLRFGMKWSVKMVPFLMNWHFIYNHVKQSVRV